MKLPVGNYWVEGYNAAGEYNGGIVVTVAEDTTAITFQRVYAIYATNNGWIENTDYTIDYQVVSADGMNRKAEPGTSTNWGTTRTSGIFVEGDTLKTTLTPVGDKAADYNPITVKNPAAKRRIKVRWTSLPRSPWPCPSPSPPPPGPLSAWASSATTMSMTSPSLCLPRPRATP